MRDSYRLVWSLLTLLFAVFVPMTCYAAVVTAKSSLNAAASVIDFEDFALGTATPLTASGVTITTDLAAQVLHSSSVLAPEVAGLYEGQWLRPSSTGSAADFSFELDNPVAQFGLAIVDAEFTGNVLRAFDSSNSLLEEVSLGEPEFPAAPLGVIFLGFSRASNDIKRVTLTTPSNDFVGVDTVLIYAVPEPGAIAMFVLGLVPFLCGRLRRVA